MCFKKAFYIALILLINIPINSSSSSSLEGVANNLKLFNELMNKVEYNLRKNDTSEACLNSSKASDLITSNITSLRNIQPNYDWNKINELLQIIPIQLCQK